MEPEKPSEEQAATPSEVWSQLDPELRARVVQLLARLAYRRITAQPEDASGTGAGVTPSPAEQSASDDGEAPSS